MSNIKYAHHHAKIIEMVNNGVQLDEIAAHLGIPGGSMYGIKRRLRLKIIPRKRRGGPRAEDMISLDAMMSKWLPFPKGCYK